MTSPDRNSIMTTYIQENAQKEGVSSDRENMVEKSRFESFY